MNSNTDSTMEDMVFLATADGHVASLLGPRN
jgi:hypothetical protein